MSSNMVSALIAGDTLDFLDLVADYPPADGWELRYRLTPRDASATPVDLVATAQDGAYRVQVAPSTTASWAAGFYTWTRWVQRTGARQSLGDGQLVIKPDPAALPAGYDGRSQARKALDDLKAAHATFVATNGMTTSYKIAERERVFRSTAEIIKLITFFEQQVAAEDLAAGRTKELGRRIYTRL